MLVALECEARRVVEAEEGGSPFQTHPVLVQTHPGVWQGERERPLRETHPHPLQRERHTQGRGGVGDNQWVRENEREEGWMALSSRMEGKGTWRCMDGHHGNTGKVEAPFQTEKERKGIGPTSTEMGKHTENSKDERAENRKDASGAFKGKEA